MISEPKIFYLTYQKDYHKIKAIYLKGMLDNLPKYEQEFFKKDFDEGTDAFRRTLKSDLRQTYFHAIETFFELFFALNPKGKKSLEDEYILLNLTNSKWRDNYEGIKNISEKDNALDFLDEKIMFKDYEITIGHYLFYFGIVSKESFPQQMFDEIRESIKALKYAIKTIALDFVNRDEYNAYKHGLRLIPSINKLGFADAKTMEIKMEFDLKDAMSFYLPTKNPNEISIVTKVFDTERDYLMTYLCANMINSLILFRRISMRFEKDKEGSQQVPIGIFSKEAIDKCLQINVDSQDWVSTYRRS